MNSFVFETISLGVGTGISSGAVVKGVAVYDFITAGLLQEVLNGEGLEDRRGSEEVGEVKLHGLNDGWSRQDAFNTRGISPGLECVECRVRPAAAAERQRQQRDLKWSIGKRGAVQLQQQQLPAAAPRQQGQQC